MARRPIGGMLMLGAHLLTSALLRPLPRPTSLAERLAMLPKSGLPLRERAVIRWNDRQVPFIEAASDEDLAVALGLVHAHLRLAQMELLRRVSQGRMAELLGAVAVDFDHALRILDLGRAVPAMEAALPDDTRAWLEGFARGINAYLAAARTLPHEFAILGIGREAWSVRDLLALGRLAAADFTWIVWMRLLRLREHPHWPDLWDRLVRDEELPGPSFSGGGVLSALGGVLQAVARSGSNSAVVASSRSATGAPWIASDPHLSLTVPNLWLIAGCRSPSLHAVGLMIPGIPVFALGRNPWIAWGGTNLHAASSDLIDVSNLPEDAFRVRHETIRVRWGRSRSVTVRETALGPVLSDARLLDWPAGKRLALKWVGHEPSDEMTALLRLNRARGWEEFRTALEGFAVPGQNMLCAEAGGRIGQAMAAKLPRRPAGRPADLISPMEAAGHWKSFVTSRDLPARLDPPSGFHASANDRPSEPTTAPVGFFFSPPDRVQRLRALLEANASVKYADLAALQQDVHFAAALPLRDRLVALGSEGARDAEARRRFLEALAAWDGTYAAASRGALAFELLLHHFCQAFHGGERLAAYSATWTTYALIRADIEAAAPDAVAAALPAAIDAAAEALERLGSWGEMHRLRLAHPLGAAPLIGRRYRWLDIAASGSTETLLKTAHGLSGERHGARYGSNARHISDLSDPDGNFFVLVGGQDGWIASSTFLDQVELWQRGEHVQVPLRPETARTLFAHVTELAP